MNKLEQRSKNRENLVKLAKDSVVERASKLFLAQYRSRLDHLKENDQVPNDIPVGKDRFVDWVKDVLSNYFPEVHGVVENAKILKEYAVQIADTVAKSDTNIQNPLKDYVVSKDPIFIRANKKVYVKAGVSVPSGALLTPNLYSSPEVHSRYCPDHPGAMLRRVSDNLYQCPISGDISSTWKDKYSYTGGHPVKFETGVQNQTHLGPSEVHPLLPFLSGSDGQNKSDAHSKKGKPYDFDKLYDVSSEFPARQDKKKANLLSKITKFAEAECSTCETEKECNCNCVGDCQCEAKVKTAQQLFAPTTMPTRQCPDHPGQQLGRVADNQRVCPLDGRFYDFTAGFTTDDGVHHLGGSVQDQGAIPIGASLVNKEASVKVAADETVHSFLYSHVLPYLPAQAEHARRVLNYKFSRPGMTLEQALKDISKADELAKKQEQVAELKSFTKKAQAMPFELYVGQMYDILKKDYESDSNKDNWPNRIFDGDLPEDAFALLHKGDTLFGQEKASRVIQKIVQKLAPMQLDASLKGFTKAEH